MNSDTWVFVDDLINEAKAFAGQLRVGDYPLEVEVHGPAEARELLLSRRIEPAGVLMDVDLSSAEREQGTGPGLAQDLRVKQRAGEIPEFPIARFAALAPVEKNVKGDPASDDLFDIKIQKEELGRHLRSVQSRLRGLRKIYEALGAFDPSSDIGLDVLLGTTPEQREEWSHRSFDDRMAAARQIAPHVAAGAFMRGFLLPTGLLIDAVVLGIRLGVDPSASGKVWRDLLDRFPFKYSGVASEHFERWWARGFERWWFDTLGDGVAPPVALTVAERVEVLSAKLGIQGLIPLKMPAGSPGERPWRLCALSLDREPPEFVPVDAAESVRISSRADLPIWVDPLHAALKPALQEKHDLRLNRSDLLRLGRKYG